MNRWMCFWCFLIAIFQISKAKYADDVDLNITEITKKYGFPVETHEIETEDGYLLDVYRIPFGRFSRTRRTNRYPVILNHGLLGSAENFILMGQNKSLAYMLADYGFDVWLCNARGSWHSRKHRTLHPDKDAEYWQFTWHEIGIYDLPATIDYVLNVTNTNKVHFVGHSQGTTTFFVMCSEKPEYNEKIKVMVAMAPSAILGHLKEPFLRMLVPFHPFLERLSDDLKEYELLPFVSNRGIRSLGKALCGKNSLLSSSTCRFVVSMVLQDEEMDKDVIPLLLSTVPAGASVKQGLHYAQIAVAGTFRKYDWGPKENMRRYNSRTPPEYNIKHITAPIAIFYGEADDNVAKEDVEILAKLLPNVVEVYKVPSKTWTHMDFLWAKNIDELVNNKIIEELKKYNK
ncbi:lipase 3-like isoform X2 [Anoplophora glabripennis]|uniref:lipase 3-like isoform X2 n=1 Tax=Anoplophora glabripennis TaxID=217634 RepID=UPI0008744965|nr:lipase 3-like isoform X2 [Anoplophora glabripennis]